MVEDFMKPKALTREQLRQLVEGECEEIEANDCRFRRKPATYSDLIAATLPI
jgi:hypothetical protein